uniref:Uncharacterized protein n=1 Tax=Myotis lucifugus TaxID=59463 RepID=G1QDG5_MYOLU
EGRALPIILMFFALVILAIMHTGLSKYFTRAGSVRREARNCSKVMAQSRSRQVLPGSAAEPWPLRTSTVSSPMSSQCSLSSSWEPALSTE